MKRSLKSKLFILLLIFSSCNSTYDHDLMYPDGHHGGYYLTQLGCLVNGPWLVDDMTDVFNTKLFLNAAEVSSAASFYDEIQKDLIFQLHKSGAITYWFKSENRNLPDINIEDEETIVKTNSHYVDSPKKVYTTGFWKANFIDSTLLIHFENKNIGELNFKISQLTSSSADFQQTSFFDSLYNGNKVRLKKVNTLHYRILYPTL
ncbi:hypothetical protein BH10BAC2_BH10BAC2_20900 [soil metagenome]